MSEPILESIDHQLEIRERASLCSRRNPLQKGLAGLVGFLVMGATVAPVEQNWRPHPKDNFPFSYYPMFSEKRGEIYAVSYIVGLDVHGNRHLISHRLAGSGGLTTNMHRLSER